MDLAWGLYQGLSFFGEVQICILSIPNLQPGQHQLWGIHFLPTESPMVFPYSGRHASFLSSSQQNHHHVGSAPSGVPFERHFGHFSESPETSFFSPITFGGMGSGHNDRSFMVNMGSRAAMNAVTIPGNLSENCQSSFRMMSSPRLCPVFLSNGPFPGLASSSVDSFSDRVRSRLVEHSWNRVDSKNQFQLHLDKITNGEDTRTTLMIKNIPNKYTSKMLLAAIDENHRGTYDFFYLPIDFKNKCNVGYAVINMLSPAHISPFYEAFNGKKWEKFNSSKVASLAYARIQGKASLVTHFQNSSLMNEDKRCSQFSFTHRVQRLVIRSSKNIFPSTVGTFKSVNAMDQSTEIPQKTLQKLARLRNQRTVNIVPEADFRLSQLIVVVIPNFCQHIQVHRYRLRRIRK